MNDSPLDIKPKEKFDKKPNWKVFTFILLGLLIFGIITTFVIFINNYEALDSWKELYEKEKISKIELKQTQDIKNQEYESTIKIMEDDYEKLQQSFKKYLIELTEEQKLTSRLICNKNIYDYSNVNFEYGGNTAMNRELRKFIENNILKANEKVTGTSWEPIWNNVDVGMHKISITGNTHLYFIVSFLDNKSGFENSIYWIDEGCFLDFQIDPDNCGTVFCDPS